MYVLGVQYAVWLAVFICVRIQQGKRVRIYVCTYVLTYEVVKVRAEDGV